VSAETGLTTRASGEAIGAVIDGITDALAREEKVTLVGFGTFQVMERKARIRKESSDRRDCQDTSQKSPQI